jgi:hypothetical protein
MKNILRKNREFWTHDRSITALLIYLILSLFLWIIFSGNDWIEFIIRDVVFNLIVISGVFAVLTRWRQQIIFILLGAFTLMVRIFSQAFPALWLQIFTSVSTVLFFGILTWLVMHHVFKEGPVNFYRIQAAIVIYIIMGIIWATLYDLIYNLDPTSFDFIPKRELSEHTFTEFLYFSFVTISTLGYGDVVPLGGIARSLVIFQGMFGMLYPVVMIARLVTLEIEHKKSHPGHIK